MTNKIKWHPGHSFAEYLIPAPKPAKLYVPEWYKDMHPFQTLKPRSNGHGTANTTAKSCMPLIDSFTMGYIQETWCDIFVSIEKTGVPKLTFDPPKGTIGEILDTRGSHNEKERQKVIIPNEFHQIEYIWKSPWWGQTPKGWSMIYTHPFNRQDLPFQSFTGVVESDTFWGSGNYPFFLKKGFEGLIPSGTPMYQMIPIKRDSWQGESMKFDEIEATKMEYNIKRFFYGGYKKLHWIKKDYS